VYAVTKFNSFYKIVFCFTMYWKIIIYTVWLHNINRLIAYYIILLNTIILCIQFDSSVIVTQQSSISAKITRKEELSKGGRSSSQKYLLKVHIFAGSYICLLGSSSNVYF